MTNKNFRCRDFSGIPLNVMLTGSTVLGGYEPDDVDYLVDGWLPSYVDRLEKAGYEKCWSLDSEEYPDSLFHAYRKGNINLIFPVNSVFRKRWVTAHEFLLKHPELGETKEDRIEIFSYFRSPEDKGGQKAKMVVQLILENERLKARTNPYLPF